MGHDIGCHLIDLYLIVICPCVHSCVCVSMSLHLVSANGLEPAASNVQAFCSSPGVDDFPINMQKTSLWASRMADVLNIISFSMLEVNTPSLHPLRWAKH